MIFFVYHTIYSISYLSPFESPKMDTRLEQIRQYQIEKQKIIDLPLYKTLAKLPEEKRNMRIFNRLCSHLQDYDKKIFDIESSIPHKHASTIVATESKRKEQPQANYPSPKFQVKQVKQAKQEMKYGRIIKH